MNAIPPVEAPAATSPRRSRATAPTVSSRLISAKTFMVCRCRPIAWATAPLLRRWAGVGGAWRSSLKCRAKRVADGPAIKTWGVLSSTRRAALIGWRTCSMPATAPACNRLPSISAASIRRVRRMDVEFTVPALGNGDILVKFVHLPRAVLEIDPFLAEADRVLLSLRTIPRHTEAHVPHGIEEVPLPKDQIEIQTADPER